MKIKNVVVFLVLTVTALLTIWQLSTPVLAADEDVLMIISTTIGADGSGEFRQEVNGDLISEIQPDTNLEEDCLDNAGSDSKTKIETRNGVKWCVLTMSFDTFDQLPYYDSDMVNELAIRDDTLYYDLDFDPDLGFNEEKFNLIWKVTTPGDVIDHNADKKDGCNLTWTFDTTEKRNIYVESKTDGVCKKAGGLAGNTWLLVGIGVVCCCLLLMVVAAVILFVVFWKKQT